MTPSKDNTAGIPAESSPCCICGGPAAKPFFSCPDPDSISPESFNLARCPKCDLVYVNPRPAAADMGRFYFQAYYKKPGKLTSGLVRFFDAVIQSYRRRRVAGLKEGGRILDVGCGNGAFLAYMGRHGWESWGVETSPDGASMAAARPGLRVFNKELLDCGLPAGHFDVITLWHSVEHIPNPVEVMREARRLLKEDGVLFLALPNFDGWEFSLFGGRWFHLDIPRHLYQYSPKSVSSVLALAGFEVTRVKHFSWEYNVFGCMQSLLNLLTFRMNCLYKLLKGVKSPPASPLVKAWDLGVTLLALPPAALLAVLYALVSAAFGRAGSIEVYARKKS